MCMKGGLIHQSHDEVKDELCFLAECALTPSAVRDEPLISMSHNRHEGEGNILHENHGDILIRGLWQRGTESILDVQVVHLEAPSYIKRKSDKVLASLERAKQGKYECDCHVVQQTFSPFVLSADGMMGDRVNGVMSQLARLLAKKWHKPYSVHYLSYVH